MLVLGVETATGSTGVALAEEAGVLATVSLARGRRHGENLAPAVEFVCAHAGVALPDLDAVAVDVGPGLFTGLRVGVATAKGLGFALGVPVVEVGSLELLAVDMNGRAAVGFEPPSVLVPVVDARRGQLFAGRFRSSVDAGPEQVAEDRLVDPGALADDVRSLVASGERIVCAGDGARRYSELLGGAGAQLLPDLVAPDPGILATVGRVRAAAGAGREAAKVAARYLRPADVRINWETRFGQRAATG